MNNIPSPFPELSRLEIWDHFTACVPYYITDVILPGRCTASIPIGALEGSSQLCNVTAKRYFMLHNVVKNADMICGAVFPRCLLHADSFKPTDITHEGVTLIEVREISIDELWDWMEVSKIMEEWL